MNTYTVYFEFFGRKMRTEVDAYDLDDAVRQVRDKVIIHKVAGHTVAGQGEPKRPTIMDFIDGFGKH